VAKELTLRGGGVLRGRFRVPGDKSISHRALILNALAVGEAHLTGLLDSEDLHATARCLGQLGVQIEPSRIIGRGGKFSAPDEPLDCGNSGTTIRLLMGLLAGQHFKVTLTGDRSLRGRPMARVAGPLSKLGALFEKGVSSAPLSMSGGAIVNQSVQSSVASAQVKTAVLLTAVQGEGLLEFIEPTTSRDHTERMMRAMGVVFEDEVLPDGRHRIRLGGPQRLKAVDVDVPGDISSAAFFIVAASILAGSDITICHLGVNPSRTGIIDALQKMGANITIMNMQTISGEPVADIRVRSAALHGVHIDGDLIPRMVDELPVLAVAMACATGRSTVRDALELRVKESDRIAGILKIVTAMGCAVTDTPEGFTIDGCDGRSTAAISIDATGDHRIAMAAVVAGLKSGDETRVSGGEAIASSFPQFMNLLEQIRA